EVPAGSNIVESKGLLKGKGDEHGTMDKAKAGLASKDYSEVEGVDCFDTVAATASTSSIQIVAAMACKLD
ncbi:unnamed protein product, partial [Scytosiphon promiscuus]